jgi:probable Rubsico expression protein CbbX
VSAPLYQIPGSTQPPAPAPTEDAPQRSPARTVGEVLAESQVESVLDELERDLVGLAPVKQRIRDIAALLVVDKLRLNLGLQAQSPSLHMCFTGNPGTGKTTVAMRMAEILHRLGYVRKGHLVAVTRDDLVGQYIGHTAPKTKEVLKKAMGGVLFIDEAYYLYRPENERDYGQEAIEILLQVMENQRDDLVVILAGYKDRMDTFFQSNPGMSSRIAHHIDFPDYSVDELLLIAGKMLAQQHYRFGEGMADVMRRYLERRITQPNFANARSVRNALDRARLRQASAPVRRPRSRAERRRPEHPQRGRPAGQPRVPGPELTEPRGEPHALVKEAHADAVPDRAAAPLPAGQRRAQRAHPRRLDRLQGDRAPGGARLAGRGPRRWHRQRAGRGAKKAGRHQQRDVHPP